MKTLDLIIETDSMLSAEDKAELANLDLQVSAVVGKNAYRLRGATDATLADVTALGCVTAAEAFAPEQKLDRNLLQEVEQSRAIIADGLPLPVKPVSVLVSLDPLLDTDQTLDALRQLGEVKQSSKRRALLEVNAAKIQEIAQLPGVMAAEVEPDVRMQNNVARSLTQANPVADNLGLDGAGEIVGVADSGLDTGVAATVLPDFAGRIVNIRATVNKAALGVADGADLQNHGTHVSGSILGDGSSSNGNLRGLAPAAQLTMLSMGPNNSTSLSVPADLTAGVFQDAYNDNARLHNNSWSSGGSAGAYQAFAQDVDQFVRDNPDMLILFAAGNDGDGVGSVTSPGVAKNCVTVGAAESVQPLPATATLNPNLQDHDFNPATPDQNVALAWNDFDDLADDADDIADFSGRGPTDDGRIKPDIVAPGTWILSTRSTISTADTGPDGLPPLSYYADDADDVATHAEAVGRGLPGAPIYRTWDQNTPTAPAGSGPAAQQNHYYNSGTSMAAPITTGAATLLRQYLRQRRGVANPSAALMKAMLVNGATVPAGESNDPNNTRGFGWLDMENTLQPAPTGQQVYSDDVNLAVTDAGANSVRSFTVQLADPAEPFRVTLTWTDRPGDVNIGGVQNQLYLRVIDPGGTTHDGDTTPFPAVSNNVQRVHIDAPAAGTYTIEVHGVQVLFGIDAFPAETRQDFALAVINAVGFSPDPVDICQVIDKSGSMGTYGYMAPVKERAKQLVDMLRINDRSGAAAFDGGAALVHSLIPITSFADQTAIKNDIDLLTSGGVTSMGAGLELGQAELTAGGDASHAQALVLLSDGHENTPPWVGGGATDSPPAWYGGPDFTEILPTLPAATKIYTVSLGVQSDEVLLQDIATLTGGVFHAIHSAADIAKLHEIYVHLQALTGGEEVIVSGSDSVSGVGVSANGGDAAAARTPIAANGGDKALLSDMAGLTPADSSFFDPHHFHHGYFTTKVHEVPVDETIRSVTMMVSWHELSAPVELTLISPSHKVIRLGNRQHLNRKGSSYQFFRIENPEPGAWRMVIRSAKGDQDVRGNRGYTWGAYAKTPIGIRFRLPKKLFGLRLFELAVRLAGQKKTVRSLRFRGTVHAPRQSVRDLLKRYKKSLDRIDLQIEPDNPKLDPDLFKLAILDRQMRKEGKRGIFASQLRRMKLTRTNKYTGTLELKTQGVHNTEIVAAGRTRKGFAYRRETRFSLRN